MTHNAELLESWSIDRDLENTEESQRAYAVQMAPRQLLERLEKVGAAPAWLWAKAGEDVLVGLLGSRDALKGCHPFDLVSCPGLGTETVGPDPEHAKAWRRNNLLRPRADEDTVMGLVLVAQAAMQDITDLERQLKQAGEARKQAIRDALLEGVRVRELAALLGVSPARIGQLSK